MIRPFRSRVLIQPDEQPKSQGGIELPQDREWVATSGTVVQVGKGSKERYDWKETPWRLGAGYGAREAQAKFRVVAIDYGVKRNILRLLADQGCEVIVAPATASSAVRARTTSTTGAPSGTSSSYGPATSPTRMYTPTMTTRRDPPSPSPRPSRWGAAPRSPTCRASPRWRRSGR